jgi:heme exporter protein D
MKFSSYSELLSDNYNYLVWSILAISITIGGIYYIKNRKNE